MKWSTPHDITIVYWNVVMIAIAAMCGALCVVAWSEPASMCQHLFQQPRKGPNLHTMRPRPQKPKTQVARGQDPATGPNPSTQKAQDQTPGTPVPKAMEAQNPRSPKRQLCGAMKQ